MREKLLLLIMGLFLFTTLFAQNKLNNEDKNHLDVSMGITNAAYENTAASATSLNNTTIFTPSLLYRTKNGFSVGLTGYLANDSLKGSKLFQTGVSAGYDYYGKNINAGISYTRYLSDINKYNSLSIYQNEIYGYVRKAKGAIQPGVEFGFDNGNFKEYEYASIILKRPANPRGDTTIKGFDSTINKDNFFTVSPNIGHDFVFKNVFAKGDSLQFTPTFYLNFGNDNLTQTHLNKFFQKRALAKLNKLPATNTFQLQTIALSFETTYYFHKFFLEPNLYIDYFVPPTKAKRTGAIFSLTAGFSF